MIELEYATEEQLKSIEYLPLYYDVAYKGLWQWPGIYQILVDEIKRCAKEPSYLSIYKESYELKGLYQIPILDTVETRIYGTETKLLKSPDGITLDIHKFNFKDTNKIKKSIFRIGWTKENLVTLKNKNIPEFFKLKNIYHSYVVSTKDYLKDLPNTPRGLMVSKEDTRLIEANKIRVTSLFNILENIEELYTVCYVEFINQILLSLNGMGKDNKKDSK